MLGNLHILDLVELAYSALIHISSSGRTFASFFKEQYKGDTYPADFSASTDFVRFNLVLVLPPELK